MCHYWYSLDKGFKFQPHVCNSWHGVNSVFRTGKNYYPQVILEECKYVVKEKRIPKYITEGTEISFDESVKEILTKKILAKKNLMKKIKLVPSASFRYKRKAEKRPWNTLNT